ncbi:hypothetical protein BH09SUM1_BH09SUM1_30360 [soil metagenome]
MKAVTLSQGLLYDSMVGFGPAGHSSGRELVTIMPDSAARFNESLPSKAEKIFLGLVREGTMSYYVGRASQLTDDELRSVFAVVCASQREATKRDSAGELLNNSKPAVVSPAASHKKEKGGGLPVGLPTAYVAPVK